MHGGHRTGAGRKRIIKKLSNYNKAISLLNANILPTIQELINGLKNKDKKYKVKCLELLLKKTLPDKSSIELEDNDSDRNIIILTKLEYDFKVLNSNESLGERLKRNGFEIMVMVSDDEVDI